MQTNVSSSTPEASLVAATMLAAADAPRLAAILQEVETEILAARHVAADETMPDEFFGWEERAEISNRLAGALTKLRRVQQ